MLRNAAGPAGTTRDVLARPGSSTDVSRRRAEFTPRTFIPRVATRPGSSTLQNEASAAAAALERSLALPSEEKKKIGAENEPGESDAGGSTSPSPVAPLASTTASTSSSSSSAAAPPLVSLADRRNPGASAEELASTWEHRAWVAGTSALLLALAAQGVGKCLADSEGGGGGLTSVAVALGASYLLSDFLTAVYHWSIDNYGDGNTPIVGGQIAAFQGHHQVSFLDLLIIILRFFRVPFSLQLQSEDLKKNSSFSPSPSLTSILSLSFFLSFFLPLQNRNPGPSPSASSPITSTRYSPPSPPWSPCCSSRPT